LATEADIASLASSHDIIAIGMMADEARRGRHGAVTTFVRVAEVGAEPGLPIDVPPAAGEVLIVGPRSAVPQRAAREEVAAASGGFRCQVFHRGSRTAGRQGTGDAAPACSKSSAPPGSSSLPKRRRSLRDPPARSEVNIAGLSLGRLTSTSSRPLKSRS
jgi:hypothetical protein